MSRPISARKRLGAFHVTAPRRVHPAQPWQGGGSPPLEIRSRQCAIQFRSTVRGQGRNLERRSLAVLHQRARASGEWQYSCRRRPCSPGSFATLALSQGGQGGRGDPATHPKEGLLMLEKK